MAMVKVCLALLVLCICSSLAQSPWQAFFTDARHGGRIASCVEGSLIWGVYSNGVGYFQGNISSDGTIASGKWYEAGHVDGATGSFSWTLTTGQNGFSGIRQTQYYRCAPSIWSETKITAAGIPTREDCKRLYDNTQIFLDIRGIEGSYTSGVSSSLHICVSPTGHYELSYFIGSTQSYSTGYVRAGSVLGTGSFVDSTSNNFGLSNTGIEMLLLADPDATNLGLRSNNGTRLVQYRFRGVSDATDVDVSVDQVSVREWTRSTVFQQSCDLFRQLYTQPWVGAWTDNDFGFGRLYVCQTVGGTVRGVYSELGWIEGSVSNDGLSVNGRFYDAGDSNQVSGDFTWTLVDRTHFTGHWSFDNSAKRYWWNETRVSVGKPSSVLCMLPDSSVASPSNPLGSTIAGVWRYDASPTADTLDICFNADNTRFEASYNFNGGVDRGYITGFVRDFGSALQGEWHETGLQGILTMQLTAPNVFYMLRWTHGDIQASYYYVCDDESGDILWVRHRNVAFTQRTSTTAKASSCARNADLINFAQAGPFVPTGFTDKYAVSYVAFKEPKKRNIFEFFMGLISNDSAQDDDTSSASALSASAPLLVALAAIVICCICQLI